MPRSWKISELVLYHESLIISLNLSEPFGFFPDKGLRTLIWKNYESNKKKGKRTIFIWFPFDFPLCIVLRFTLPLPHHVQFFQRIRRASTVHNRSAWVCPFPSCIVTSAQVLTTKKRIPIAHKVFPCFQVFNLRISFDMCLSFFPLFLLLNTFWLRAMTYNVYSRWGRPMIFNRPRFKCFPKVDHQHHRATLSNVEMPNSATAVDPTGPFVNSAPNVEGLDRETCF